ncbi:hypothetical protein AAVH_14179 [Aphelenchoides avenae]|nr:hypothetical protein AAVH_14179 [Aphelenchus avenae]
MHDIHLSLLWRVVPILPVLGGYVTGPLRIFGDVGGHVGLVIVVVVVTAYVVSVLDGLVFRLFSLLNNRFFRFMKTPLGIAAMFVWQFLWAVILGAFMAASYVPSSVIREQASQV